MDNDLLQTLKSLGGIVGNSNYPVTQQATLSILKSVAGQIHAVNNGMVSCPTLTLYDNASGASGSILLTIEAGSPAGTYLIDLPVLVGISAWVTGGKAPSFSVLAR